jgi:cobalt-precorrin 5A hydrolase
VNKKKSKIKKDKIKGGNLKMIIGIGTRRGVTSGEVKEAVSAALSEANLSLSDIDRFASSVLKEDENGLIQAVFELGKEIRFLPDDVINENEPVSESRAERFGLKGVCEPAALALSIHKKIIFKKKVYGRVTIAIAE